MDLLLYGALLLSQLGTAAKQYAMKKCGGVAKGAYNSICVNLWRTLVCLAVSLIIWLASGAGMTNLAGVGIGIGSGIGTAICLFTWILAAQRVSLTLLEGAITVGSLALPLVLSPLLFGGERASLLQWLGAALVVISLFCFSGKDNGKKAQGSAVAGIALVTVCALGQTVASIGKKVYTFHITDAGLGGVDVFTLISFLGVLLTFAVLFLIHTVKRRREASASGETPPPFPLRSVWVYIVIAAVGLYMYELFATYASDLPSAIYYPISKAISVLGSFLLDVLVFRDRITPKKIVGLILLVVSVVLINL
jgi:drug/metabolite transporter (DMT)-like permease